MKSKQILDKLNRARRALDSLSQVEIIDDWEFENELKVWYLHFSITIEQKNKLFPKISQWYIVVDSNYPKGKIKIYPDVENSMTVTLYHQANNSRIERNGLWRKGSLCLEVNTLSAFQTEPSSVDERLLYHVKRAINWLELAAEDKLISEGELFEMPDFTLSNMINMKFAFSEDVVTLMQWESTECRYGIAELDVYKSNPLIYYVKQFKALDGKTVHYTQWGKQLSKTNYSTPINALWILLKHPPVINVWQAPETFSDLLDACKRQHIDLMEVMKNVVSKIRDGKRHLLLLGFPIPKTYGGESERIFWQALFLPVVSYGKNTAKGFRPNHHGWWLRDKSQILTPKRKLEWIISENWNQQEISQRGKMSDFLLRKKMLLVGAGCVGASVAEIFVRSGVYNLTILDSDIFEVGNLSRHVLNVDDIGELKQVSLCNYLNSLNPHANVEVINDKLTIDEELKTNVVLDKYDIIIDCTGENRVLDVFQKVDFKKNHIVASISVGLGAKHLYISLMNGKTFNFSSFYEIVTPYIENDRKAFEDYKLPRDGTGCWHPTFPARSDDVWLATSIAVKSIENYIATNSEKNLLLVYGQKEQDGFFESYALVDKKEYG